MPADEPRTFNVQTLHAAQRAVSALFFIQANHRDPELAAKCQDMIRVLVETFEVTKLREWLSTP